MKTLNASNTTLKIGDKFKRRRFKKCGIDLYEIIDIHTTWNFEGDKIKTEYLCTKDFLGKKIKEIYNANSIFMSIDNFKFYESANLIN